MRLSLIFALFTFAPTNGLVQVDTIRKNFYILEGQQWTHVKDVKWRTSGVADIELAKVFVSFNSKMQRTLRPPQLALRSQWWQEPRKKIQQIEEIYEQFLNFTRYQSDPNGQPYSAEKLLTVVGNMRGQLHLIEFELQHLIRMNIFKQVLQEQHLYFNRSEMCEIQVSPHQLIYDIYNTVALTELKAYAMMQFSLMIMNIYGRGNIEDANQARKDYEQDAARFAETTRGALNNARKELYRCDPLKHVKGETYDEITRLVQGYIENEVDMNNDHTCWDDCQTYKVAKNYGCFKDQFCSHQPRCNGVILDCKFVQSHMNVCISKSTSTRRYEWIKYKNGYRQGHDTVCSYSRQVDSWWRWIFYHCSYCMCLCDDPENSDRYFSLKEAASDIQNNKVITGVRLVKFNRIFHLQISQGTLKGNGLVTSESLVFKNEYDMPLERLANGKDYHTLNNGIKAIDLDDLEAPDGYVLTAVRFGVLGAHLNLRIRVTKFNFETGRLLPRNSMWLYNDNTDGSPSPRRRQNLKSPDIPTRNNAALPIVSKHDQFIEFTHSDFDADAAQSTVPFIDIQPVSTYVQPVDHNVLLRGVGLMHRGMHGSGGYIALKLFSYDYTAHVRAHTTAFIEF